MDFRFSWNGLFNSRYRSLPRYGGTLLFGGVIRDLVIQKEKFRKELVFLASKLKEFKLIESIPGIGELTAALLISELGDIRRFHSNKQLNAYVGIDIRTYQPGTIHYRD